jgi:hypothetical protein
MISAPVNFMFVSVLPKHQKPPVSRGLATFIGMVIYAYVTAPVMVLISTRTRSRFNEETTLTAHQAAFLVTDGVVSVAFITDQSMCQG